MTTTTTAAYRIVSEDDEHSRRIVALAGDTPICGAYRPHRLNDWRFYVTKAVSDLTGVVPHKVHVVSRADAVAWTDTIATLYTTATPREGR